MGPICSEAVGFSSIQARMLEAAFVIRELVARLTLFWLLVVVFSLAALSEQ